MIGPRRIIADCITSLIEPSLLVAVRVSKSEIYFHGNLRTTQDGYSYLFRDEVEHARSFLIIYVSIITFKILRNEPTNAEI